MIYLFNVGDDASAIRWPQQLGGAAALASQLADSFNLSSYDGGLIIQIGPTLAPIDAGDRGPEELTDFEMKELQVPETYRRLARVLRPVRIPRMPALHSGNYGGLTSTMRPRRSGWRDSIDTALCTRPA
jgi:TseV toxin immunity protein TsiV